MRTPNTRGKSYITNVLFLNDATDDGDKKEALDYAASNIARGVFTDRHDGYVSKNGGWSTALPEDMRI